MNAEHNGIHNARFIHGPAEEQLSLILKEVGHLKCVAVVDPPRAGLREYSLPGPQDSPEQPSDPATIKAIRKCEMLR